MPTSDPATILLTHDLWATGNLIDSCRSLSHDQFHQKFEMGMGSLHDSIRHILSAMRGWGDLLVQREQRPGIEGEFSLDQFSEMLTEYSGELMKTFAEHQNDELVTGERGGRSFTFARGAVITHVTTHAMHHRAQCLNMLRHLGVEALPISSVVEWVLTVDSQK